MNAKGLSILNSMIHTIAHEVKSRARGKVGKVLHEFKAGTLRSSSGQEVTGRDQAIAIGLSEARRAGANIPKKPDHTKRLMAKFSK